MHHRGFLQESFRESIVKNYREHRFARGGSTISMQLVKNVFLSRDKTVSRKAEEALIVYLIENLGLVPKERMLEVYLNVIEWGPNVYGIGEASHFYFNKRPSQLTLQESLFLASVISRDNCESR
jgi:membrane peptidoglycan carboxypeptidase